MRVTMMLADHAVVADGKLFISGGGWSVTGPQPVPSAIALKIDVPWDRANDRIQMRVRLLAEDGQQVTSPGPLGEVPIEVQGEFEVGRPPGLKHGTAIDVPLAFNIAPIPLAPGRRFVWELSINGETKDEWQVSFTTRDANSFQTFVVDPPGGPA